VRIDCYLCGVKMLDLDFCLNASVNVRYILHTQPLRFIYNKILVCVSLYPSLSLSILVGLSFSNTFWYRCMLSFHLPQSFFFYVIHPYSYDGKKTESATPMTITTTMLRTHHVSSSCWPCILSFWRPCCHDNMSIKRCHLKKEDPCKERWRMMLARL
jgi:hypothetical protein